MFFCDLCANKNKWPDSIMKSEGPCEMCGKRALCNDVPSKYLPSPPVSVSVKIARVEAEIKDLQERLDKLRTDV